MDYPVHIVYYNGVIMLEIVGVPMIRPEKHVLVVVIKKNFTSNSFSLLIFISNLNFFFISVVLILVFLLEIILFYYLYQQLLQQQRDHCFLFHLLIRSFSLRITNIFLFLPIQVLLQLNRQQQRQQRRWILYFHSIHHKN